MIRLELGWSSKRKCNVTQILKVCILSRSRNRPYVNTNRKVYIASPTSPSDVTWNYLEESHLKLLRSVLCVVL